MGMRFTRGIEYPKCKTCNTELYRHQSKNSNELYTNTCVLRSHFYCDKHDLLCREINRKNTHQPTKATEDEKKLLQVIRHGISVSNYVKRVRSPKTK
jgi:hypothetical protein